MRLLVSTIAGIALLVWAAQPAAASCAPPATVSENAGGAVAVVHGTVTGGDHNRITLRVDRVLKGGAAGTLTVYLGPTRGGGATSVDYTAPVGTAHVLYLVRAADGQLETNACIGSHAGSPSAEESAFFGSGTAPSGASEPALPTLATSQATWIAVAAVLGSLLLLAFMTARRRARALAR